MATIAIGIDKGSGSYTARVPVNSLAEDGTPPEEGDSIQCSVEGTVQSVTGNTATVKIDSINGEPVSEEAAESPEEESSEEQGENAAGAGGSGGGPPGPAGGGGAGGGGPGGPAAMADIAAMGKRLRKGARGRPMPF